MPPRIDQRSLTYSTTDALSAKEQKRQPGRLGEREVKPTVAEAYLGMVGKQLKKTGLDKRSVEILKNCKNMLKNLAGKAQGDEIAREVVKNTRMELFNAKVYGAKALQKRNEVISALGESPKTSLEKGQADSSKRELENNREKDVSDEKRVKQKSNAKNQSPEAFRQRIQKKSLEKLLALYNRVLRNPRILKNPLNKPKIEILEKAIREKQDLQEKKALKDFERYVRELPPEKQWAVKCHNKQEFDVLRRVTQEKQGVDTNKQQLEQQKNQLIDALLKDTVSTEVRLAANIQPGDDNKAMDAKLGAVVGGLQGAGGSKWEGFNSFIHHRGNIEKVYESLFDISGQSDDQEVRQKKWVGRLGDLQTTYGLPVGKGSALEKVFNNILTEDTSTEKGTKDERQTEKERVQDNKKTKRLTTHKSEGKREEEREKAVLKLVENYNRFQSYEWLYAKTALDHCRKAQGETEKLKFKLLGQVFLDCDEIIQSSDVQGMIREALVRHPLEQNGHESLLTQDEITRVMREADNTAMWPELMEGVQNDVEWNDKLVARLKLHAEKTLDKESGYRQIQTWLNGNNSERTAAAKYLDSTLRLALSMRLQTPPMVFKTPQIDLNNPEDMLYFGSKKPDKSDYGDGVAVFPALWHGDELKDKGRLYF